jgi:hypothetical protein
MVGYPLTLVTRNAAMAARTRHRTIDDALADAFAKLVERVQGRLAGELRDFQLVFGEDCLILFGHARTYRARQHAQDLVREETDLLILLNKIEVP